MRAPISCFTNISIHAPARGATQTVTVLAPKVHTFQSTLPRGERPSLLSTNLFIFVISIHAPARGATPFYMLRPRQHGISIHAPARGATFTARADLLSRKGFQSTLPRGERQLEDLRTINPKIISIHAPARGATTFDADRDKINIISIHAPARGATPL